MKKTPALHGPAGRRRGMLLLLVLSVLALFVAVGAVGLISAIRARESARAFAAAASSQTVSTALAREQLDAALLKLIRGPSASGTSAWGRDVTESLLEDKYGGSQPCTISQVTAANSALIQVVLNGLDMRNPAAIAGRVLTFVPQGVDPTGPTSYRIVLAAPGTTTTGTVWLANVKQNTPLPLPSRFPCEAIINGREFTGTGGPTAKNEPYDAFDDPATVLLPTAVAVADLKKNPFLTVTGADLVVQPESNLPPSMVSGTVFLTGSSVMLSGSLVSGTALTAGTYTVWPFYWGSAMPKVLGPAFGPPAPPAPDPGGVVTGTVALYPLPPCTVDNDGDGVADGVWLSDVLPPRRLPDGNMLSFDVSYLILDLDGRINLNAHGSLVRAQFSASAIDYPRDPRPYGGIAGGVAVANPNCFPVGMGYGPADVDASLLLSSPAEVASGAVPAGWRRLLFGGIMTTSASTSTASQWRPVPWTSGTVRQPGRYDNATSSGTGSPGRAGVVTGTNRLLADHWVMNTSTIGTGTVPPNSPTDLKARLQVFTGTTAQGFPTLSFGRLAGSGAWSTTGSTTDISDVSGASGTVHPYALRLDEDAPRAAGIYGDDAIFTLGEMERILRPFDSDTAWLDPRLAAMLDDVAEPSRLTVTTDSWDTPAITGPAASLVLNSAAIATAAGCNVNLVHSPEVVAGLRMSLNRPIFTGTLPTSTGTTGRHEYFKHLYSLVMALSAGAIPPSDAAQWAANVVEFRDPDSIMTWYPYDPTPFDTDGFTTGAGSPGVWGAERPEMVIRSATYDASTQKVTISLFRPWDARVFTTGTPGTAATELIDGSLGSRAANTLTLTGSSGGSAWWRVALVGSSTTDLGALLNPTGAATTGTTLAANSGTTVTGSAANPPSQVVLLRIANPGSNANPTPNDLSKNEYVAVHAASISTPGTPPREVKRWLHWPNRDFVSHGELMTVPSGTAAAVAEALFDRSNEQFLIGSGASGTSGRLLLDATLVPSMFAGANVSVVTGTLANTGYANFRHSQFSRWREAGRVNLNTVVTNTGNGYVVNPVGAVRPTLDNAVWTALLGRSGTFNPVGMAIVQWPTTPSTEATTMSLYSPLMADRDLLVSGSVTRLLRSGTDVNSAFLERSSAIRLGNVATPRSHVFAVWITVRITDSSATAGAPRFARLFAIVDRSIPVGYAPGRDLNVRETIRLLRYLE